MSKKNPTPERRKEVIDFHDYTTRMEVSSESTKRKEAFSPCKNPSAAKKLDTGSEIQDTLKTLVISVSKLSDKVDTLGSQMQQQAAMLASIAKSVEFNAAEIKECKAQQLVTVHEVSTLKENNLQLKERVLELERYKRRWNLRIKGVKEKEGENTRELIAELLVKISPEWSPNINFIIDTVHRLGRREENRVRPIIVQFTQRTHRDMLWRKTKESAVCKELGVHFIEDLCQADRETRSGQKFTKRELRESEPITEVETDSSMVKRSPFEIDRVWKKHLNDCI